MPVSKMDNVLIVVEDLEATTRFFLDLGLTLEGQATVEGPAVGALIGLDNVRATLTMLRTADGGTGIELDKFHTPNPIRHGPVNTPVNALGIRRIMFTVDDIDALVARMNDRGADIIGTMNYENTYRLAYIRGPEGIIVGLAESQKSAHTPRKPGSRSKPARRTKSAGRTSSSKVPPRKRTKKLR